MNRIDLQIKALSPLAIGRHKPGGSISEVEDYIPGTVLRGAIAGQILRESGHGAEDLTTQGGDFPALFLSDHPAIFQNAYPAVITVENESTKKKESIDISNQAEIYCLPATALSSKNNPGFKINSDEDREGVFDTLIDRFCAQAYDYPYDPCTLAGERVDNIAGFYCCVNDRYYAPSSSKRLLTRVGINRRRATAEDAILYSIEVLNESKSMQDQPVVYKSAILVADDNLASSLQRYIHDRASHFRLGGSTSRGLGSVEITAQPPTQTTSEVQTRIETFNQSLQSRWKQWQVFGTKPRETIADRTFFTLDLQAHAILTEHWQRTTVISAEMLRQFTGVKDESLSLHTAYSTYDYRGGWNAAWGLMKDMELVTTKGAVYLFSTTNPTAWYSALAGLEWRSVGDRTSEGFGQVRICDEFHLVFRENAL